MIFRLCKLITFSPKNTFLINLLKGRKRAMNDSDNIIETNSRLMSLPQSDYLFTDTITNKSASPAFCISKVGCLLYVNEAMCHLSEYSRSELKAMTLMDIDVGILQQNWYEIWQELKNKASLTIKTDFRTKTNRIIAVEISIKYIEPGAKGVEFGCVFVQSIDESRHINSTEVIADNIDISAELSSEYRKTEAELEVAIRVLRSTLESAVNGILAVSFEGEILCYNQKFMDIWHLPEGVPLSRHCERARAFFESQVKEPELFRTCVWEMPAHVECERYDLIEFKDGRILAHYSEPHRMGDKIIGRVWSILDVTESKKTEDALRLNEARFRTLAENTEASIFLIQNSNFCYVNPAAASLTGYSIKELLTELSLDRLVKNKRLRQVNRQDGGSSEYREMQIVSKDGTRRWLACTVTLLDGVFDCKNTPFELVTAIDITDYKQAEAEVSQALEQSRRLSELRQKFVSMLCHQFRTPLNVVSFSADLLRRHIDRWNEEKKRSYLDLILSAVEQISHLLDDILLFGKAEAAKLECQPRQLDLNKFCRDIAMQAQLASGNEKIVNFITDDSCTTAYLDPKLLHHILNNLLTNAIKYSSSSKIVELELACQSENVIFLIKDRGVGIAVVDQQQIFEPFYRGNNVDNIEGTGLGLSIVKTLVELHRGQITVESQVGKGTTFKVVLPTG